MSTILNCIFTQHSAKKNSFRSFLLCVISNKKKYYKHTLCLNYDYYYYYTSSVVTCPCFMLLVFEIFTQNFASRCISVRILDNIKVYTTRGGKMKRFFSDFSFAFFFLPSFFCVSKSRKAEQRRKIERDNFFFVYKNLFSIFHDFTISLN